MMPELSMADALGATNKPLLRVHTAGSVGGSTAVVASHLVQSRQFERVLTVAYEKQSEGNAQWGLAGGRSGGLGAGGYFAPWIRAYITKSHAPAHIGWQVAVKDRLNACKNPYAHLQLADITIEKVKESPMLRDPIHYLESRPSSDGVLSSNPIGASGMLRFAEAALHVRGEAGDHQVDGATVGLGQAYGGGAQYFAMWVVGATPDAIERKR